MHQEKATVDNCFAKAHSSDNVSLTSHKRVIIIGAGCSGIGAARTLINAGIIPVILEARDCIGGRLKQHVFTKNLVGGVGPCGASAPVGDDEGSDTVSVSDCDGLTEGEEQEVIIQLGKQLDTQ